MSPQAPKVAWMIWTGDENSIGEGDSFSLFSTEDEAIEAAKSVAGEMADSFGGECAVIRCDLTRVGVACAVEAEYASEP